MAIEHYRTKDGTHYRATVRVHRKKISKTFKRKVDAETWEREVLLAKQKGTIPILLTQKLTSVTLEEFWKRYIQEHSLRTQAPSTLVMDESIYRNYVQPYLGHIPIAEIHRDALDSYLKTLQIKKKLTNERVNRVKKLLSSMFNRAVEWSVLPLNPIQAIRNLPSRRHLGDQNINYLTQSEANQLLDWLQLHDAWLYGKVRVLLNAGLRIGELAALRVQDLRASTDGWYLSVSRTYCRHSYTIRHTTKGQRARIIPIGKGLGDFLYQQSIGKKTDSPLLYADWLEYKHQTKLNQHFKKALIESKVRKVRVHDLRHSFAVHFLENGGHLYDLQNLLGHQSSKLTERYSHFSATMLARARGLVDHHGNLPPKPPTFTVIGGGKRDELSHKCPINTKKHSENEDSSFGDTNLTI